MKCEHAAKRLRLGSHEKTFCEPMGCWTNCEEAGHCLKDGKAETDEEKEEEEDD